MRGLLIFATAFAVCLLLPQRVLHGVDGNVFVVWIEHGSHGNYARHAAYLHLCGLVYAALEPFGAGGHLALRVTSALGTALGLVFLHRAFLRLLPAHLTSALLPTLGVFVTPACFYYATQGEIAGVFMAGAGLAWWLFACWLDRPTVASAAALGLGCAAAGSLHALGHLLTPAFMAAALVLGRFPRGRARLQQTLALLAGQAALAILVALLFTRGAGGQAADAASIAEEYSRTLAPSTAPAVLWREWIMPFLPWSIGALLALFAARARRFGIATLVMVVIYLGPNVLLLGYHGIHERGAYFVGLLPIAVLATARFVTARGFLLAIAAAAVVTVLTVSPGWFHPLPPDFGAGIEQLDGEQKVALVVSTQAEMDAARTSARDLMVLDLREVLGAYIQLGAKAPPFAAFFDTWHDRLASAGMRTVLTASARRFFAETKDRQLSAFWREHVPGRYALHDVERLGFHGVQLQPR